MSLIDDLVADLCPDGVSYKPMGEVGVFLRGKRFVRSDMREAGFPCIHYGEIYTHYGTSATEARSFVAPDLAQGLRKAAPGDVIIVAAGESVEDIGKAVAWLGSSDVVIHDACFAYRHELDPKFVAYLLQTGDFKSQLRRSVSRSKVMSVLAPGLERVRIPVPPLAIQQEVARVLELMEELNADLRVELEAEMKARRRQYLHHRDTLLSFADAGVTWLTVDEVGSLYGGLTGKGKADFNDGNARYASYVNIFRNAALDVAPTDSVRVGPGERQHQVRRGDVLFTASSESVEEVGMSSSVVIEPPETLYLNSFCFGFRPYDTSLLEPRYSRHLFRARVMRDQIIRTGSGVTRINVSKERFRRVRIPVPPLAEQLRIADILDSLDALENDLSSGLPAEIVARRQQYEFYRDRLLSFPELVA